MDEITQAARAWFRYAELPSEYGDAIVAAYVMGYTAGLERAAKEAGGATGPKNTPDNAEGYSAACRDIRAAITRLLPHPPKEGP